MFDDERDVARNGQIGFAHCDGGGFEGEARGSDDPRTVAQARRHALGGAARPLAKRPSPH
jgi:hypothetical protein